MKQTTSFKISLLTSSIFISLAVPSAGASDLAQAESAVLESISRSQVLSNDGHDAEFSEAGISKDAKKSIGLQTVTSDNVDVYAIPLGYGLPISILGGEEYINFSADLPYVNIEGAAGDKSGMGDVKVGAEYFIEQKGMIFKGAFDLKFPTGDEDDGLGSGSTDIGVSITGRKREAGKGFNATAGYILRGEGSPNNFKRDYGNVISLVGGAEYQLKPAFWVGLNLAYIRSDEDDFSIGGTNPGVQTFDLIPNASYRVNTDMTLTFEMFMPVQDSYVGTSTGFPDLDRELSFSFGLNSEF